MTKKLSERISHEDIKTMRRVVGWLEKINRLDPLQQAVGHDLADMADAALTTRAIINIRAVNAGRPRQATMKVRAPREGEWTEIETESLRTRYDRGETYARIAEVFGRTEQAVASRVQRLGWNRPPLIWQAWTDAEDARLKEMVAAKAATLAISRELGRTLDSVARRVKALG